MRFTLSVLGLYGLAGLAWGGLLPFNQVYVESGGFVGGEAEDYHATATAIDDTWTLVTNGTPGAMQNVRGTGYMRSLPDGDGTIKSFATGASIDYRIQITTPGTYRLWLRWDGVNDSSDSLFAGLLELTDGAGGLADWYELSGNLDSNFSTKPWDGLGGFEENTFAASQNPIIWTITNPGIYTLRFAVREDGSALDTWLLQLTSRPDPAGDGFVTVNPDAMTMHHQSKAGIPVLKNDTGLIPPSSVEVVDVPSFGSATPTADGRILYTHTNGAPATDTFTYRVRDIIGIPSPATSVTITFSPDLRIPNTTVSMPSAPPPVSYSVVDAFPGITFITPTSMESPPGDTNRIFVAERRGQVHVITGVGTPTPQKSLFMDISNRVDEYGNNELGMKGITFHPGFLTNGYFFLTYCHWDGSNRRVRLSRFSVNPGNPNTGNPNSEFILINQKNDLDVHNIDDILFGPDGYLYLGIGDEGFSGNPGADGLNNSQRIDKDIWSAILRIDPDKRSGNLEPNPHEGIPLDGGIARFSIPTNNPFIGATQFNGIAVNPANVRTEFYAVGLRNPWQFSFDALTDELWVADVGNDLWEEVTIMPPGGNGGWVFFEGNNPGPRPDRIPPSGFTYNRPVWEYPHGSGEFLGKSITGGFVYRGANYPGLFGKYICGDYVSGNIWTIERTAGATNITRIAGEGDIVQFGLNPANGDILMLDLGNNSIRRLVTSTVGSVFPETLTDTGFFADLSDLAPNPGVIAYQPNLSFWSDYAIKSRWFVITNTTDRVGLSLNDPWSYPAGMMWVKHFDLEMDRGNPTTKKRIETRVLVRTTNGAYGVSYQWNTNGTEATLAPDAGIDFVLAITNDGEVALQQWLIPSRAACLACHTPTAGHALSFNTRQLNCGGAIAGTSNNFIALLETAGYTSNSLGDPSRLPRHVRPDETEYSLEARTRSYLAVNCGYCHMGAQSVVPGNWDGRAFVKLDQTGLILGQASSNGGNTNNLLIVPADVNHSIIWNRIAATNGFARMPPLGTTELDPANIQLVAEWINGDLATRQSYAQWQIDRFGSTNHPNAAANADPDLDGRSNREEFLTYTDPEDPASYWTGWLDAAHGAPALIHDLAHRAVTIEVSTNLNEWVFWNVPENNGLPIAEGSSRVITLDTNMPVGNFRFIVDDL
jgi:glucose/arabinose dehydrogenase